MSGPGAVPMVAPADVPAMAREQAEILHSEIARLPKSFRLPVILCYFEGLTLDQAAQRLRWPVGTVRSRLARRRQVPPRTHPPWRRLSIGRGDGVLSPRSASAFVSSHQCAITTRAALSFAAGQAAGGVPSTLAVALAKEVLKSMLLHNLKVAALTLLLLGAIATGGAVEPIAGDAGRTQGTARREARRASPEAGPGSDARHRPRIRPPRKARAQRGDNGLRTTQGAGTGRQPSVHERNSARPGAAMARAGFSSMRRAPHRHGMTSSAPSLSRLAMASAGWSSTRTPNNPPPTSPCARAGHSGPLVRPARPTRSGRQGHGQLDLPSRRWEVRRSPFFMDTPGRFPRLAPDGDLRQRGPLHRARRRQEPPGRAHGRFPAIRQAENSRRD